ncbi:TonB-dependent receptor [Mucilaginibacter sp. SMC90]|uniref:TonB-dependent receptor n=1 Tax=Mucilaginibacter sp. SMC90 TaxID=2929803 RepID=UPI001FB47060|nr:TonB-dependent receptor [Mucilaginibacter sp. SMC90]UOE50839.1 TonB-dependent receptor [Mucilaginibacter sp. SMC90]
MNLNWCMARSYEQRRAVLKFLMIMKLIFIMVIVACLHVSAKTYGQLVSVNATNKPLTEMFKQIQKETGYRFFWEGDDVSRIRLSVDIRNASLDDALQQIFNGLPLTYSISKNTVVVQKKEISLIDRIKAILLSVDFHVTVNDDKGQPLPGATISIKGNNFEKGAITDQNGESKIEKVPQGDYHIVITSIGFARYEKNMTVNSDNKDLVVTLATLSASLNEVVVVGYGTQQKATLTSSVETVSSKEIVNRPVPSVLNILQGEAAGLNIQQTDGNPGYGSTSVDIRGNSTISNNPVLYIVDGMAVNGIDYLNPNDIESVSILKDASATAIYGARASGGVLLVTTKKGKLNSKPIVQYSSIFGYQRPARLPKFVDAPQFVDLYNQAQLNDNPGVQVKFTPDVVQKYKLGELPSTNWLPYILHNQALQNQQNLSVAGGSGTADYFVSGGYLNQGGLIKNVDYKRYSTRANVNVQVSKRLKLGINTVLTKEDKLQPSYGLGNALQWSYIVPVTEYPYTKGGHDRSYRGGDQPNDIMTKAGVQNETLNTINTNFLAEFKILDNLLLNATYGYNYTSSFLSGFNNKYPLYNDDEQIVVYNNDPNSAYKANYSRIHPTTLITLNYNKSIGKHNIKALAGYSQEQDRYDYNSITRYGFLNNSLDQIDAGSSDPTLTNVSGNATEYAIRSWFGRVNYNYDGKYLLEANARYDGTSVFENKKYGFFPSVSAGWVASEEDFFKPLANTVNFLKVRASLGQVGNQNASGLYPWANTIGQDKYVLNKAASTTTFYNNSPNPNLTWEVKTTINLGLDLTILRHLDVNIDLFRDRTTGILQYLTVPTTYGISGPQQNVGILRNQGFEINVAYKNNIGKLNYRAAVNFSDARNKILSLGGAPEQLGDNPLLVGQSRWVWYGLQAEGLFQSKDDIANHATQDPRDIPGDIKIKDVNGDGKITPDDRVVLGQATPHYRYGISLGASYGGFDASILLQGVMSNLLRVQGGAQVPFYFNGDGNILQSQLDYWSPSNPNARYPILRTDQSVNNGQFNSWWLFKAAYMRFKNAQIGYTFSDRLTKRLGVSSVRFFVTGDNLLLITSKNFPKSLDPEIANYGDGSNYPQVRNISLGLNVTF